MVLTSETQDGQVAVANLTTHDPERRRLCDDRCVLIRPESIHIPHAIHAFSTETPS